MPITNPNANANAADQQSNDSPPTDTSTPDAGGDAGGGGEGSEDAGGGDEEESGESPFRQGMRLADDANPAPAPAGSDDGEGEGEEPQPGAEGEPARAVAAAKGAKPDPIEAEITALGLRDKAAQRFRELAKRPPEREVATLRDKAQRFDGWMGMLNETGAKNQQLSAALGYIGAINSGDPERMTQAFDSMLGELQWLAGRIGREVPGFVDPLAGHADLIKAVEDEEMTRDWALKVAQARASDARRQDLRTRSESEQRQLREAEQQAQRAIDVDVQRVNDYWAANDPDFETKVKSQQFVDMVQWIRDNVSMDRWGEAVDRAYRMLPAPAPRAPAPSRMPLRPTGASGANRVRKFKDPTEAFRAGVRESAS